MLEFLNLFRAIACKLQKDGHNIEDVLNGIKSVTLEISERYGKLLKFLWTFHNHRTHIFFSRRLTGNRLTFIRSKLFDDPSSVLFSRLVEKLQEDPSVLAHLVHFTRSEVSVLERICFLVYTAFGNFGLDQKSIQYLNSFTDCLLHLSSTTVQTTNSPVDNSAFVCVFKVLYANLSCVRRYLTTLLQGVLQSADDTSDITDTVSSPLAASVSLDDIYGLIHGPGGNHLTDNVCAAVNRLISRFQQTVPLFPGSILLLLGKYRAQLTSVGVSDDLKRIRSVELIVDLFVVQGMLHPLSYGACFRQHLQPHSRFMWLQMASGFRYLAHISHQQIPSTSQDLSANEESTFSSKLAETCDVQCLHGVLDQILESADLTFSNLQHGSPINVGNALHLEEPASQLPNVILATPTDLNILLDCLRLLRTAKPEVTKSLNELLDGLPTRIPAASFGVCQIKPHFTSSGQSTRTSSDNDRIFKLVQYGRHGKDASSAPAKTPLKLLASNERSQSASRMAARSPRLDVPQGQSNSLDRVDHVSSRGDSPIQIINESFNNSVESVYIIPLADYQWQVGSHLMPEAEFMKSFSQTEPKRVLKTSNPSNLSGQTPSSLDLSAEDGVEYKRSNKTVVGIDQTNEEALIGSEANPQSRSQAHQGLAIPSDLLDTSDLANEENSVDHSNDPSSDLSDRSGCTSLASSAHAMGRRLRFLAHPVECDRMSDSDQVAGTSAHPSTDFRCTRTQEANDGKHTQFRTEVRVNPPCGTDNMVDQLSFDTELTNRCSNVLHRSHLVRTSSAEWPRHALTDGLPHSVGEQLGDLNRNDAGSPHSSLNSLQTSGFDAASNGSSQPANRADSEYLSGLPDRDEVCSLHTCSSCGICVERPTRTASSSNLDFGSHAHLDTSRLDEEDGASSDLPLSSANVSGRMTPLSLTSSTSRGPVSSTGGNLNQEAGYNRAGFVLPNGTVGSTILQCSGTPDVTEKFHKFELPPSTRPHEVETRSTISDTWSTDVLPSDTEYTDLGSEAAASETHGRPYNTHRHRSRRHGLGRHLNEVGARLGRSNAEGPTRDHTHPEVGDPSLRNEVNVRTNTLEAQTNGVPTQSPEPPLESTTSLSTVAQGPCATTSTGGSLQVALGHDTLTKVDSPSITPLGRDGSAVVQAHGGSSRIKDMLSGHNRSRNGAVIQSHFPWHSKDRSNRMDNLVVVDADRPQRNLNVRPNGPSNTQNVTKEGRSASLTSTNSAPSLNVDNQKPFKPVSRNNVDKLPLAEMTNSESVEQMLDRYRRQSIETGNPIAQPTLEYAHTSASPQAVIPVSFEQIKRTLYQVLSHPLVNCVIDEVTEELRISWSANSTADHSTAHLAVQDRLLIAVLESLLLECMNCEDIRLTTRIKETTHLFRSLVDYRTASSEGRSGSLSNAASVDDQAIAERLLNAIVRDRSKRKAYLAHLSSIKTHLSRTLRQLNYLSNRWERVLQLQCEDLVFTAIASVVDSQTESVDEFLRQFAEHRLNSETEDGQDPAPLLVNQFVDELLSRWTDKYPASKQLIQLPLDDVDFAPVIACIKSPRSHIEYLVLETLYRSGVWMHDTKVERQCDKLLYREISLYKKSISMSSLRIPPALQNLYPFVSIQDELMALDSSHVPSDMIACLKRVVERIVATLTIGSPDLVPSADDILPLLIYILIQVNPPRLLANSNFFEIFHDPLDGEDEYVWCQFRAAVSEVRRLISRLPSNTDTQSV